MPNLPRHLIIYLALGMLMLFFASTAKWDNADGASYFALLLGFILLEPWILFGSLFEPLKAKYGLTDLDFFIFFYLINAIILFFYFRASCKSRNIF